jgi:hypothetical protein
MKNILNLEIDKLTVDIAKGIILLKTLNSLSPRSFSFINPALLGSDGSTGVITVF